jgi:hypothetical protein
LKRDGGSGNQKMVMSLMCKKINKWRWEGLWSEIEKILRKLARAKLDLLVGIKNYLTNAPLNWKKGVIKLGVLSCIFN